MTVLGKPGSRVRVQPGHPAKMSPKQIGLTVSTERDRIAGGEWAGGGYSQRDRKEAQIRVAERRDRPGANSPQPEASRQRVKAWRKCLKKYICSRGGRSAPECY